MTNPNNKVEGQFLPQDNYKQTFDNTPISIVLIDMNGQIVEVNSATENLFGFERENLINLKFTELYVVPADKMVRMKKFFTHLLNGGIFGPEDIQIYNKDKKIIWVNVIASKIELDKKSYIQVLTKDISLRKTLEQEIKESEERYRGLYESSPISLTVTDSKGVILNINSASEKIFGFNKTEVIGKRYTDLGIFSPQQIEIFKNNYEVALKGKKLKPHDFKIKKKDGTIAWINVQNSLKKIGNEILIEGIAQDITERKIAEAKLKESEEKYRNLADSLPEVIFEIDLAFNITYTNSIASKIFGYTNEEFREGMNIFQFVSLEDKELTLKQTKQIFRGEYVKPLAVKLNRKDGTYFFANIYASRILKDNKVIGVRCIIHDITEMKITQEKIKESEEKYRLITENANDLIFIVNLNVITEYINEEVFKKLLGYTNDDVIGKPALNFIHSEDIEKTKKLIRNGLKAGEGTAELRCIDKKGFVHWLEIRGKTFKSLDGETKAVFFAREITKRKKTEEKLRESEEKYRFLFEKSPVSILLINTQGKIEDCNPALEKLIRYDRYELIGDRFDKLPIALPEYLPILLKRLKRIAGGESIPTIDIQLRKKDGALVWVNIDSSLVKLGEKTLIMVMVHNISDTKELEIKLKELNEMRKEFIDRASHELKTPITTVYGAYQLLDLLHKDKFNSEQLELFEMASIGTKRIKKLVDDLLDVSLMESKSFKLNKSRSNLSDLIINCVKEMKYFSNKSNHVIDIDIPPELNMNIDESRIELVLTNIISNAIKYTPSNGKISIKMKSDGQLANIEIRDSGVGLTKEEIKNLFKKFSTIEAPLKKDLNMELGSTGLGLFLSKEIIKLHQGEIWAESEGKGKGSTFIVKIPIE